MDIISKLKKSKFRSSFYLNNKDKEYIKQRGLLKIEEHASDFINKRLKTKPKNDGKQTPWRGHPVFKAQHATGICCRNCIQKWHKIPKNKILDKKEIEYLKKVLMAWIKSNCKSF